MPLIALLHGRGGFPAVLGAAATFGAVVSAYAAAFLLATSGGSARAGEVPAE